jgi:hypothetical protein
MAKRLGIGATCSIGVRYLHPKRLLKERFSSTTPKQHLSGLLSLQKESKKLNGKNQCCVVLSWISRWTCPGWVFCPQKPHPFGNEYHSICCGDSGIMYQIELVEGKDAPTPNTQPHSDKGKTVGLLLRLCQGSYT